MRMTEDQFENLTKSRKVASKPQKGIKGKGRTARRVHGQMNATELAYSQHLDALVSSGEILSHWFEGLTFKLADKCRYTPDFMVMLRDGSIELHEVKGYWEDDALVKIKVAAELFPFRFIAVQKIAAKAGGGWSVREF